MSAPETTHAPPQDMPHILLVDDALTIRAYLERLLTDAGYRVSAAINGAEGLERALLDRPDMVLADLNMPQMNGLEMVKQLRANSSAVQMPVAMLTTEQDDHDIADAIAVGANFHMSKPPQPETVLEIVHLLSGRGDLS
ncbi:MAG: response regulator [Pseudomonadota bacterium]